MQIWKFIQWLGAKFEKPLMILAGAAGLTAVLLNLDFNLLEANLYDLRMARGSQPARTQHRADHARRRRPPRSTSSRRSRWICTPSSWRRSKAPSPALGYLVDLNQVNQVNPELFPSGLGHALRRRRQPHGNARHARAARHPLRRHRRGAPALSPAQLPHAIAVIHKDGNVFAEDKITRRALTSPQRQARSSTSSSRSAWA